MLAPLAAIAAGIVVSRFVPFESRELLSTIVAFFILGVISLGRRSRLLAVACDSIRGFVLALLIGIITGTYSSIFNASTLLVAWHTIDEMRPGAAPPGRRAPRRIERRVAV